MRMHERFLLVKKATLDIEEALDKAISVLEIDTYENLLYHIGEIKLTLLKESGATVPQALPVEGIPDDRRVLSAAIYQIKVERGLTDVELYRILTDFELGESKHWLRLERHGDTDKKADEA